jgi:HD-GYP domain-containing protein (c-di-GMP phosphodiesterase class II)
MLARGPHRRSRLSARGAQPGAASSPWAVAAEILARESYEQRLDAVLELLRELIGTPGAYLYLPDASGRRLRLERISGRAAPEPATGTAPDAAPGDAGEGGAGWSVPSPPLEIARSAEDERDRVVSTPVGEMHAFALLDHAGALVAVVQSGPAAGELGVEAAERMAALRGPLALAVAQARAHELMRQRLAEASTRLQARERLAGSALDVDRFVRLLLDMAVKSTRTQAGFVAIQGVAGLEIRAQTGTPDGFAQAVDLSPEGGLFDWTPAAEGGALLADLDQAQQLGISSLLAMPLQEEGEPLGIFALVNFGEGGTFDDHSLELIEAFGEQIRLMLHNARLFNDFTERYVETVKGIATALDARRPATHGHHQRVGEIARALAGALGLDAETREAMHAAGLVHDVGLAAFAGVEGTTEVDIEHPTLGASLVEHLPLHPEVAGAIATHHEWYDGWGFPQGLAGEQIPLGGRVLAAAEFIVEMSTETRVRPAWSPGRLSEELAHRRGTQFDPAVADAALALLGPAAAGEREGDELAAAGTSPGSGSALPPGRTSSCLTTPSGACARCPA